MISEIKWVSYIFEFSDRNSFASTVLYHVKWEIMKLHSLAVNDIAQCVFVEQQKGLELWGIMCAGMYLQSTLLSEWIITNSTGKWTLPIRLEVKIQKFTSWTIQCFSLHTNRTKHYSGGKVVVNCRARITLSKFNSSDIYIYWRQDI